MTEITEAEWIAELQKHIGTGENAEGFTTEEWSEKLGISVTLSRELIRKMVKNKKMELGLRFIANDWDGRNRKYRVYKVL